jgi:hypothetical protein
MAIETKQWALVDILQDSGADTDRSEWDSSDTNLVTPLQAAVEQDNEELVLSLLKLRASLEDLEILHLAIKKPRTFQLILSELSKEFVIWSVKGVKMYRQWLGSIYISSEMRQKVVRMLVESHADLNYRFDDESYEDAQSIVLIKILEANDFESA